MKYDIYLWEHPSHLPPLKTFEQGTQEFQVLESKDRGVANPKFIAFGEQLAQRFPGADSFTPDSDEARDAPWPTSPAISAAEATRAVYLLGVPDNQWEHVMAAAVEIGTKVGLTVLIDQLSILFLPSGEILPEEEGAFIWENFLGALEDMKKPGNELLSKPDLRKLMVAEIQKILTPHGFKAVKNYPLTKVDKVFSRETPNGIQWVLFTIKGRNPYYTGELYFRVYDKEVDKVVHEGLGWDDVLGTPRVPAIDFDLGYFAGRPEESPPIATPQERTLFFSFLADKAMKMLNQSTTLKDIDALLNDLQHETLRLFRSQFDLAPVIVAWLTRNPNLQTLIDYALKHTRGAQNDVDALAAYFQKHPDYKDIVVRTRLKASA